MLNWLIKGLTAGKDSGPVPEVGVASLSNPLFPFPFCLLFNALRSNELNLLKGVGAATWSSCEPGKNDRKCEKSDQKLIKTGQNDVIMEGKQKIGICLDGLAH